MLAGPKNWLIVGLGNPGASYERTRHNLGFMLVDMLAEDSGAKIDRLECRALVGRTMIEGRRVELAKPQTYMNLSGESVGCLMNKPDRAETELVVISDDLALPLGSIRIRPKGSHGGHNGLRSIIDRLGTSDLIRLRIGIMPDHPIADTKDFVLQRFAKAENEKVNEILERSANAIRSLIANGVEKAMAEFN